MSDRLPPLADLLPHLHAGDHITAERRYGGDTIEITGVLREPKCEPGALKLGGLWVRNGHGRAMGEYTITAAPAAHQRWTEAEQPTWADGTPADDETVRMVIATKGTWDYWARISPTGVWWKLGRERSEPVKTVDLLALGAVPVAWVRTDQPAPTPATCDRDHEPPIGSIVRDSVYGEPYHHDNHGWRLWENGRLVQRFNRWVDLWDHIGPLTLVEDGTNTGAEQ